MHSLFQFNRQMKEWEINNAIEDSSLIFCINYEHSKFMQGHISLLCISGQQTKINGEQDIQCLSIYIEERRLKRRYSFQKFE